MCRVNRNGSEMLESVNKKGHTELFCSAACMTALKVQTVTSSGKRFTLHGKVSLPNTWRTCVRRYDALSLFVCLFSLSETLIKVQQWNATSVRRFECLSFTSPCPTGPSAISAPSPVLYHFRCALVFLHSGTFQTFNWKDIIRFFTSSLSKLI